MQISNVSYSSVSAEIVERRSGPIHATLSDSSQAVAQLNADASVNLKRFR